MGRDAVVIGGKKEIEKHSALWYILRRGKNIAEAIWKIKKKGGKDYIRTDYKCKECGRSLYLEVKLVGGKIFWIWTCRKCKRDYGVEKPFPIGVKLE